MSEHLNLLGELALVICGAAIAALVFHRLRLPSVLGYIVAGLVIGPAVTGGVSDISLVETLSELGVILLFFTIGLEFSIRTIARVGLTTLFTVVVEVALTVLVIYAVARGLGWATIDAIFLALGVSITSTMLVVKALEEHGKLGFRASASDRSSTELVFAIIVVEDLVSIVLLAVLTGIANGSRVSAGELGGTLAELAGFLLAILVAGLLIVPRLIRTVAKTGRREPLIITSLGVCFAIVWLAGWAGYSLALGAFAAGMLIAESGKGQEVDALVRPFRDVFAAIFFISVGMTIVPGDVVDHAVAILAIAGAVLAAKLIGVSIAAFFTGTGLRRSIQAALSLAQIGEFAIIAVALGRSAGVIADDLLSIVVGVSCVTALTGSLQLGAADRIASWLDARLPSSIATFVTFYESWIAKLRVGVGGHAMWRRMRRPLAFLGLDSALVIAIAIGVSTTRREIVNWLTTRADIDARVALAIVLGVALALCGLFVFGIARRAVQIAHRLAVQMLPRPADEGELDLALAPRRALVLTLELAIVLVVGLPIAVITEPFVPAGGVIVLIAIAAMALATGRSLTDFDAHVRAGSALIVEALGRQGLSLTAPPAPPPLADVEALLPGFEGLTALMLTPASPAVGRSLAELELRARTGASVLAILRGGSPIGSLPADMSLRVGDVLALTGSRDAVAAARELLVGPESGGSPASEGSLDG